METNGFTPDRSSLEMQIPCPSCGSSAVNSFRVSHAFEYGDGENSVELSANVVAHHCRACGLEFLNESAEDAKHEAVCRHLNVQSPSEIIALRMRLGMSRAEFSKLTRIGEATLGRWERGALIQNASNDQFLYLLRFTDNIQRLRDRFNQHGDSETSDHALPLKVSQRFRGLDSQNKLVATREKSKGFRLFTGEAA